VGKPYRVGRRVDAAEPLHLLESVTEDVSPLLEDARELVVNEACVSLLRQIWAQQPISYGVLS